MGSLKKKVLNKISDKDELTNRLQQETSTNGWITLLGNYRDLVVHSAPLANAERNLYATCGEFNTGKGGNLPIIQCPIPENPEEISASRSKGDHFADFEHQLSIFNKAAAGDVPSTDGMDYSYTALKNLAILAEQFSGKSPIAPKIATFDSSNIIGDIKIINKENKRDSCP